MKRFIRLILVLAMAGLLIGCGQYQEQDQEVTDQSQEDQKEEVQTEDQEDQKEEAKTDYEVTDISGRTIHFEKQPETKVIMGIGGLKYYVYVAGTDGIIGIEAAEVNDQTLNGQSIHYAYPELRDVEIIGQGGPHFQPDEELLAHMAPDVVFVAYNKGLSDRAQVLDDLQEKIQVPVVGIDTGQEGDIFSEDLKETFTIIGQVTGNKKRAQKLNDYLDETYKDLEDRAGELEESPQAYLGGVSYKGPQGILSTKTNYQLFDIINIQNIMDPLTDEQNVIIDKEKLIELDPEVIVLDLGGKSLMDQDMEEDPGFYENLSAFQEGRIYPIMPYFTYGLNLDTGILDIYYLGQTVFPENFEDIDLRNKATELYKTFVGEDVYDQLKEYYDEAFEESGI